MISMKILNKIRAKNTIKLWKYLSTQTSSTNTSNNVQSFDDFKCLATNKRIENKIKIILNEYKQYRNCEEGRDNIPSRLTIRQMRQLLDCHKVKLNRRIWIDLSPQRRKHLLLLFKRYEHFDGNNRLTEPIMPLDVCNDNILGMSSIYSLICGYS